MVSYKVKQGAAITEEEKRELEEAKKRPVLFDEDSPGLDPKMEQAFIEARKKKPYEYMAEQRFGEKAGPLQNPFS